MLYHCNWGPTDTLCSLVARDSVVESSECKGVKGFCHRGTRFYKGFTGIDKVCIGFCKSFKPCRVLWCFCKFLYGNSLV